MEITQVFSLSPSHSPNLSPSLVSNYGNHPSILPNPRPLPKPLPIYSVKVWKSPKYSPYPPPPPQTSPNLQCQSMEITQIFSLSSSNSPTLSPSIVSKYGNHPSVLPIPLPLPNPLPIYSVKVWKSPKYSTYPHPPPQPSTNL